jgi:hypothetical protein
MSDELTAAKTMRDRYPQVSDEIFNEASQWVSNEYSYVPYMEPARDGYIQGALAAHESCRAKMQAIKPMTEEELSDMFQSLQREDVKWHEVVKELQGRGLVLNEG